MMPARADIAVRELERLALFTQVVRGLVPEWAGRPMLAHEIRAGVNFQEMDQVQVRGFGQVGQVLRDYLTALVTSLGLHLGQVTDLVPLAALVTEWVTRPPAEVDAAARDAASRIDVILATVYVGAAGQVLREAAHQGALTDPVGQAVGAPRVGRFLDEARSPVAMLRAQLVQAVLNQSQGRSTSDQVLRAAGDTPRKQAEDLARQAVLVAHGAGRAAQVEAVGPDPKEVYASELLDRATCGPCRAVDGQRYGSLREALFDYPDGGGFRDCKGGARCRGTLVVVWPDETDATA